MKQKITLFLLFGICFSAFAAKKKKPKQNVKPPVGYIIGSVTLESVRRVTMDQFFYYSNDSLDALYEANKNKVFCRMKKRNKIYCVDIDKISRPYDFKLGKTFVYLFRIEKPIGKYRFTEVELSRPTVGGGYNNIILPLTAPFEIEENKAKYIGDFVLNEEELSIKLINSFDRDSMQINKKYPNPRIEHEK
jgi:hypothetical protein